MTLTKNETSKTHLIRCSFMEIYNEETEKMIGSVETLDIADPPQLKKMLGFFLYALGERVEMPVAD